MAIPSSGAIRLRGKGDGRGINEEVNGNITDTNVSLGALSTSAGFSSPDAMREFYGYQKIITATGIHWAVIAGGGTGTNAGAGGYRTSYGTSGGNSSSESTFTIATGNSYTMTVGGTSGNSSLIGGGSNGATSMSITSTAGGNATSQPGGSGSGAYEATPNLSFRSRGGGAGIAGQGHNGGSLYIRRGPYYAGGGGAGGVGGSNFGGSQDFTVVLGGGAGITSGITGQSIEYAHGAGSNTVTINNRGHGGYTGTVIVRMPDSIYGEISTTGTTSVTTDGSNKIIKWNSTGTMSL